MQKFTNTFSWSKTRHDTFNECKRKYFFQYYGYWGGWEREANDRTRQIYVLKQLKNRSMWAGEIVHNCLQRELTNLRRGIKPLPLAEIIDITLKGMRYDFRNSMNRAYWDSPKSCALYEHEYNIALNKEEWEAIANQVRLAITNFLNSDICKFILTLAPEDMKEIEEFSSFLLDGVNVAVKLDFCFSQDKKLYVCDWKTGKNQDGSELQLVSYALYAQNQWHTPVEDCKLFEFNLIENKLNPYFIWDNVLMTARAQIRESADNMRELLSDKAHNIAREEDFPKTGLIMRCKNCNFQKVCKG